MEYSEVNTEDIIYVCSLAEVNDPFTTVFDSVMVQGDCGCTLKASVSSAKVLPELQEKYPNSKIYYFCPEHAEELRDFNDIKENPHIAESSLREIASVFGEEVAEKLREYALVNGYTIIKEE